jgi:extradiol dioxygenase family protein
VVWGTSVKISQMGVFIRTEDWNSFQVNSQAIVTCFLPPDFSGQDEFVALQGEATVLRLYPGNRCLAVEFVKSYRQFEKILELSRKN